MSRTLSDAVASAISGKVVRVAFFAEFQFSSMTLRMWTGHGNIDWNDQTWLGVGDFAGLTPIDETTQVGASGLTFTLSGIPSGTLALALGDNYRGRRCTLWLAIMDEAWAVVDACQVYGGLMDVMKIDDSGETATISLQAESRLIDLGRPRTMRYTHEEQKRLYPGDLGLEYVAGLAERPLYWGVASAATTTPSYGGTDADSTDFLT